MIKTSTTLLLVLMSFFLQAQIVNIPDANFKQILVDDSTINTDGDTEISESEAAAFTGTIDLYASGVSDLTGLEFFTNITELDCSDNQLGSVDVSKNTKLTFLYCSDNLLTNLDVRNNPLLINLECSNNQLTSLDISDNLKLTFLNIAFNQISSLDISQHTKLENLTYNNNQLSNLDISNNTNLTYLNCAYNQITSLELSNQTKLTTIKCNNNQLTSLNLSTNTALAFLYCGYNQLDNLDVSNNIELLDLNCADNNLNSLDLSTNTKLQFLYCPNNKFPFSELVKIKDNYSDLNYASTKKIFSYLKRPLNFQIDYSSEASINGKATSYTWYNIRNYEMGAENIGTVGQGKFQFLKEDNYYCKMTNETFPGLVLQTEFIDIDNSPINIPDANFKRFLVDNDLINIDGSTEISGGEAAAYTGTIDVSGLNISDLTGIRAFSRIKELNCSNNQINNLDVNNNIGLTKLDCSKNQITSLNIWGNRDLLHLNCSNNQLETINIYNNTSLTHFDFSNNQINFIDIGHHSKLTHLNCSHNPLPFLSTHRNPLMTDLICNNTELRSFNLENNALLTNFDCSNNNLIQLDISNNPNITNLNCSNAGLKTLDVGTALLLTDLNCSTNRLSTLGISSNMNLITLDCSGNELSNLDISNNTNLTTLNCSNNIFLLSQLSKVKNYFSNLRYTSTKKIFRSINETIDFSIDYSSEAIIDGKETLFTWYDSGNNVVGEDIVGKIRTGVYNFLQSGVFHCKMSNETIPDAELSTESISITNEVRIPDANFKKALLNNIFVNSNENSKISEAEAAAFSGSLRVSNRNISDLTGIEYFTNMLELNCDDNNLSSLDLSNNSQLRTISCNENKFPFSELSKIRNQFPSLNYTSSKKIFAPITGAEGLEVNYASEILIDGNETTFTWYDASDNIVGNDKIKEGNSGVFQFLKPGAFYCKMTNPTFPETTLSTNTITIPQKEQSITFNSLPEKVYVKDVLELDATASSGLPVNFRVWSGDATISGNEITFNREGTVILKANQVGNDEFLAIEKTYTILIERKEQIITINNLPEKANVKDKLVLDVTSSSSLWVNLDIISGDAFAFGHEITFYKEGTVIIKAKQQGNTEFLPSEKTYTILIEKKEQTISFNNIPEKVFVKDILDIQATASSSLWVNLNVISGDASLKDSKITFNQEGAIDIKATQLGNDEFLATEKIITIIAEKREQSINFNTVPEKVKVTDVLSLDASASSGLTVSFEVISGDATITENQMSFHKKGTVEVKAIQAGNDEFLPAEKTITILAEKKEQSITFNNLPELVKVKDVVTLDATADSGLEITYELMSGDASLSGNTLTINQEGNIEIKAIQPGNDEYLPTEKSIILSAEKREQSITIANLPETVKVKDVLELSVTASSDLEVRYELISGDATLSGNTLTPNKAETVTIKAIQDGDAEYNPAERTIDILVEKKEQNITFQNPPSKVSVKDVLELEATASSLLNVRFELVSGDASLTDNTITFNRAEAVTIKAIQDGNDEFLAAEESIEIQVEKKEQIISFQNLPSAVPLDHVMELGATASSDLEVQLEVISGEATLNGTTITFNKAGTVTIKATQAGNEEYQAVERIIEIDVAKREQSISFEDTPMEAQVNDVVELAAVASSGLEVSYEIISGDATINGNSITFHSAANVVVNAIQAGNEEYNDAEQRYLILVSKKDQSITFENLPEKVTVKDVVELIASTDSELEVSFELLSGDASITGNQVTFNQAGTVEILATQAGNEEFTATEETIKILVEKREQTIAFGNVPEKVQVRDVLKLEASASSLLDVSFEVISGDAGITGNEIIFNQEGTVEVKAIQTGNEEFLAAEETVTITVEKKGQEITVNNAPQKVKVKDELELNAFASSELEVSYEVISGDASISENKITFNKAGTVEILATQAGNEEFSAAEKTLEFIVEKREQSIAIGELSEKVEVNNVLELNATATSGLVVSFELVAGDATLTGNSIQFNKAGLVQINAIQEGNDEYAATEKLIEIQVEVATGITDIAKNAVKFYPNPVDTELTVELEGTEMSIIRIFDLGGKLLLQKESHSNREQLNLSGFRSGMYLLRIQIGDETITHKILKK